MKTFFIVVLSSILFYSCQTEVATQDAFTTIMLQDSFYKKSPSLQKQFSVKAHNGDSLWIIKIISNEDIITRGYVKNKTFVLTITDTCDTLGYIRDTLFDANFDGINDYIINYYSGTGCCPRSESRIFLFDASKHIFLPKIEVLNAYFNEKDQTVLLMEYGPQSIDMGIALSKNKWKKDSLVLLEDIVLAEDSTFILQSYETNTQKKITSLPDEYTHIPQVNWFMVK